MKLRGKLRKTILAVGIGAAAMSGPAFAQAAGRLPDRSVAAGELSSGSTDKPNILFIMGDDIGLMQPSIYHRGLMVGETPNIDRIGQEGAIFMDYVGMQSCTSGRNAFFTGMYPLRTGMIPPQLPGSPSYLRPAPRRSPSSCMTSAIQPASSARTTSATIPIRCRRRTASRSTGAICTTWTRCSR